MHRNFKKYTKVILEPIKCSPIIFSILFLIEVFDGFQSVFVVVLMSYIILALESWNIDGLYFWTWIFIIIWILKLISSIFSDSLYTILFNDVKFWLVKKYLKEYIQFDNTKVEEYWTWKMNNIIFSWIDSIFSINKLSIDIFVELFAIIYIFILVLTKAPNIYYFLTFIFLFIFVIYLYWKWLSKIVEIRKNAKELNIKMYGKKVKILMSKFEILQNQKIDNELIDIWEIHKEYKKLWWDWNMRKSIWQTWADSILQWFYVAIFLVIWVWIINGNYNIATFALLVWILQILTRYAWQIRWYMRDILDNFINVEKLVDVFETIPKYKDDSNLPDFEFKKWNISFKNISFSYNKETEVLNNFSLNLEWWKKYAFMRKMSKIKLMTKAKTSNSKNYVKKASYYNFRWTNFSTW